MMTPLTRTDLLVEKAKAVIDQIDIKSEPSMTLNITPLGSVRIELDERATLALSYHEVCICNVELLTHILLQRLKAFWLEELYSAVLVNGEPYEW